MFSEYEEPVLPVTPPEPIMVEEKAPFMSVLNNLVGESLDEEPISGSNYIKTMYGTLEEPLYGKNYAYTEENIKNVVSEDIYNDVLQVYNTDITNIIVEDSFSEDIVNNFDFTIENVTKGTAVRSETDENARL